MATVRRVTPTTTTTAPTAPRSAGPAPVRVTGSTTPAQPAPAAVPGPTTSTPASAPQTYPSSYQVTPGVGNMGMPGASEYAYGSYAPQVASPGYAESYANQNGAAYQSAQQNTASNQLLNAYGSQIAQPTQFENWANSTAAPTGGLRALIGSSQGQVSGTSPLMSYATGSSPQVGNIQQAMQQQGGLISGPSALTAFSSYAPNIGAGQSALGYSQNDVTGPTGIGQFLGNQNGYSNATQEGFGYGTSRDTSGLVQGNSVNQYALMPNQLYNNTNAYTAAGRELGASGQSMASGVDPTTAAGQYWNQLQSNPVNLPPANLDAYYDRQREKDQAGIDKAMAARGLFGSSASADASRQMMADLSAQQVKDESDYSLASALARNDIMGGAANAADASGLSRYVARNNAAQGADQSALGLSRLGLDASNSQDANSLSRYIAQNDVANNLDTMGLNLYLGRGQLSNASDQTNIGRFNAYNNAAQGLDQLGIGAYNAQAGAMNNAGQLDVSRYNSAINAGNLADQTGVDVYNSKANALNNAGQLDVSRFLANTGAMNNADQNSIASYVAQSNTLNNAAQTMNDRYRSLVDSATAADNASRSLYATGGDIAQTADQSLNNRLATLQQGAGNADLSRIARTQQATNAQQNYTSLLESILGSSYGDTIDSNESLISLMTQLGLGAGGVGLNGALANQGNVAANGAQLAQIGAQADNSAQQAAQYIWGGG